MPAVTTDLPIEQGTTFGHSWLVKFNHVPIDDTWTARAQVRPNRGAAAPLLFTFLASVDASGVVTISNTAAQSSLWTWRTGVYDVEVENSDASITLRVAQGDVTVKPEVTR